MNHQITLEELGLIPKQIDKSKYTTPCGCCVCNHCANNVDCFDHCTGEADRTCFNCDDCIWYNGDKGTDNWVGECRKYKVTSVYAERLRSRLKVL
mgnify:FL=1|jgi:hypothetical protein|nr:MAG TPA: hypothetical protein [Caudoviricetes sp.]